MNQYEIVHIPNVHFYAQALLDKMVKVVQEKDGEPLTCLVSKRQPFPSGRGIYNIVQQLQDPNVFDMFTYDPLQNLVIY